MISFGQNVNIPDANFKRYLVGDKASNSIRTFDVLVNGRANPEVARFEQSKSNNPVRFE